MAQKVAGLRRKAIAVACPRSLTSLYRHRDSSPRCGFTASGLVGLPACHNPKGMKCQTDPGSLRPKASNRVLIQKPSYARSSPTGRSPRRRWSGPKAWRAGKKRGIFRACFPAPRIRRLLRLRVCRFRLAAPRPARRFRPISASKEPLTLTRERSLAFAKRAFLRDRGHQRAVLLEDHAAGQTASALCARRVLGIKQPFVGAAR